MFFQTSEVADAYLKFRPVIGPKVLDIIVNFCKESTPTGTPFSLALDVGCGSGQSTVPLAQRFQQVIGVDCSEIQISKAPTHLPNVSFRVGSAEDLSFVGSGSVDLVTAAAALHWLDIERFYAEAERILKPGGALVAYSYDLPMVDEPKAQETLDQFYRVDLRDYWSEGVVTHARKRYQTLTLPFPGWQRKDLSVDMSWTVDKLLGYLWSLTAYQTYMKNHPTGTLMSEVKPRLKAAYQDGKGGERPVTVTWSIFMLMGHKPKISEDPNHPIAVSRGLE